MRYILQKKNCAVEKNRFPSRRCNSDKEFIRNLDLKKSNLGYLFAMGEEQREEFTNIDPDGSLMQYLDSQTGNMKTYLIKRKKFLDYTVWQDQR